jgi:hypothetical protein
VTSHGQYRDQRPRDRCQEDRGADQAKSKSDRDAYKLAEAIRLKAGTKILDYHAATPPEPWSRNNVLEVHMTNIYRRIFRQTRGMLFSSLEQGIPPPLTSAFYTEEASAPALGTLSILRATRCGINALRESRGKVFPLRDALG